MWDLVPQLGIEPRHPALGVQSHSHWTARDVPIGVFSRREHVETDTEGKRHVKMAACCQKPGKYRELAERPGIQPSLAPSEEPCLQTP